MPIDDCVYSVYLDGRPTQRGLSKAEAEAYAEYFATNVCRLKANDKRRAPELMSTRCSARYSLSTLTGR